VVGKDLENNVLLVAQGHNHPSLFAKALVATDAHWVRGEAPGSVFSCTAKIRYRQPDQQATVYVEEDGRLKVLFAEPQRAITPGQSVVFYQGEVCLGGAIIDKALSDEEAVA
jgi:tRNA-specific 2-thiouridylase